MQRFQVFLPEPLIEQLRALSKKTDVSVAELIRRAIDCYVKELRK